MGRTPLPLEISPLFILLFVPSVFFLLLNMWTHYGYVKRHHSASGIALLGGVWAFCVAAALFRQWWAIFFFLFDYTWITFFMIWAGWMERLERWWKGQDEKEAGQ